MIRVVALLALIASGCLSWHRGAMPGEPRRATFAEIAGARVRYVDRGQGSPVVLIHGFASSLETWDTVLPALARDHRVLALDLKGFGWTDRPEGDYSPEAQARLVLALLDARGVERTAVVAHSFGAAVALALARLAPERVTRLALYDAYVYEEQLPSFFLWSRAGGVGEALFGLFYGERPDERMALAFYDPDRAMTERLAEAVERAMDRPGTRAAALATVRGMDFDRTETLYARVAIPTLLLWGREDIVTPPAIGERLAAQLPDATLHVYPRCGHFPMIEAASASTRDLAAFLHEEPQP